MTSRDATVNADWLDGFVNREPTSNDVLDITLPKLEALVDEIRRLRTLQSAVAAQEGETPRTDVLLREFAASKSPRFHYGTAQDEISRAKIHGPNGWTLDALEDTLARAEAAELDFIQVHKNCIAARELVAELESAQSATRDRPTLPELRERFETWYSMTRPLFETGGERLKHQLWTSWQVAHLGGPATDRRGGNDG